MVAVERKHGRIRPTLFLVDFREKVKKKALPMAGL
jgi:hypothetical protein